MPRYALPRRYALALATIPAVLIVAAPTAVAFAAGPRPSWLTGHVLLLVVGLLPLVTPALMRALGTSWDALLLSPVWMLCALGLTVVARVQPQLVDTQALWVLVGWTIFLALVGVPPLLRWIRRFRVAWLVIALLAVLATLILGSDVNGSGTRIWLQVAGVSVQPGEVLRIALVIFLAGALAKRSHVLSGERRWRGRWSIPPWRAWWPLLGAVGLSCLAMGAQRDFGPALLSGAVFLGMLYVATGRRDVIAVLAVGFVIAAVGGVLVSAHVQTRLTAWIDPWVDPRGIGYQSLQAIGGFVVGGITGSGPGFGAPGLIPAAHTDYPLAVIAEEWGLLGSLATVLVYGLFVLRGVTRAQFATTRFELLLGTGLALNFGLQTILVTAGVLRLLPLTGVTSPFVSYGGSSMLTSWAALALLTRIGAAPSSTLSTDVSGAVRRAQRVGLMLLAGFGVIALGLGYWQVARTDLARDPRVAGERLNLKAARVERGRLLDRNGGVLAETVISPGGPVRQYSDPSAVHVLGFNSPRFGAMGAEAVAADQLTGRTAASLADSFRDLLHEPRSGSDVRVTIDERLQQVAAQSMGTVPCAAIALDPRTGEILALVSNPTFNPNFGEEEWNRLRGDARSPLLNRATQGLYTPGSTFKTVTLAAAVEAGLVKPDDPATCPSQVLIEGTKVTSNNEPPGKHTTTVAQAYAYSCNTFFAQLGVRVGETRFRAMAEAMGLTTAPPFELQTIAGRLNSDTAFLSSSGGLAASAYGQGQLQMSPLGLALATASIANGGGVPRPRLMLDGTPTAWRIAMSASTARLMTQMMVLGTTDGWAATAAIPGVAVAAKTGSAEVAPGESSDALFIAFAPAGAPTIAVVVVKERGGAGSTQAGPVARAVIDGWLKITTQH